MRILVADDDTLFLDLMSAILAEKGHTNLFKSSNYRAVLAHMDERNSEPIDLMFCDCYVPGIDVMGFLLGLEKRKYGGQIVLMTGASLEILNSREIFASRKKLNLLGAIQKSHLEKGVHAMLDKVAEMAAKPAG